jgi:CRISPR-associated protein Csh1
MGFLQAIQQMGQSENKQGLEPYLVRPMSQDGKEIRVWLKVQGDWQDVLDIVEVSRMDLADYKAATAPLKKYLYKKPPANTTSSFTPIHLTGKMKKDPQANYAALCPPQWEEKKTHFASMKTRILDAYEREGVFTPGSVERIFRGMQEKIDMVLPDLDNQHSYMVVFVIDENGRPIYPGEVPAFEKYFVRKLEQSLGGDNRKTKKGVSPSQPPQKCNICGEEMSNSTNLDKAFKFATFDKLSVLPGLDKKEISYSYVVCKTCFEQIASGREKTDRLLTRRGMLSDIQVWAIPEAIGSEAEGIFENFLYSWEDSLNSSKLASITESVENKYFSRLAKTGQGLIFHFVFWQRNKSQEIVHLMVEDVPPERLARLESTWQQVTREYAEWNKDTDLDVALRSLHATLNAFAGKSKSDKLVFREFALKVIGNMLQGEKLPVEMFKQLVIPRLPRLIYEGNAQDAALSMRYAELWVEYMYCLNQEVNE